MAQTIKAGEPFHWMGHDYAIGDVIDTTGWTQRAVRQLMMRAPVYVDGGAAPAGPSAASAVTVDPTGLIVVTTTNVQAALAQLDAKANALETGSVELAYAENVTTVPLTLGTVAADVPGCTVTLAKQTRPVWIEAQVLCDLTTAPAASAVATTTLSIVNSAGTIVGCSIETFEAGSGTGGYITQVAKARITPNTNGDTYRLQGTRSATGAIQYVNGGIDPSFKSWIAGFLR